MAAQWQDFLLQAKGETLLRNFKRISWILQENKKWQNHSLMLNDTELMRHNRLARAQIMFAVDPIRHEPV